MAKYGSRRSQQPQNVSGMLNQLEENLKVIFLTETKCKIRLIYVRFNCKRKKWGKKWVVGKSHEKYFFSGENNEKHGIMFGCLHLP